MSWCPGDDVAELFGDAPSVHIALFHFLKVLWAGLLQPNCWPPPGLGSHLHNRPHGA